MNKRLKSFAIAWYLPGLTSSALLHAPASIPRWTRRADDDAGVTRNREWDFDFSLGIFVYTARLWQRESSDKSEISYRIEDHDVLNNTSLSRRSVYA